MWYAKRRRVSATETGTSCTAGRSRSCWRRRRSPGRSPIATAFVVSSFQNLDKTISVAAERVRAPRAPAGERLDCVRRDRPRGTWCMRRHVGYRDRPSRVIPPGVDTSDFAPNAAAATEMRRRLGWADDVPMVGFVGRFVPEKGPSDARGCAGGASRRRGARCLWAAVRSRPICGTLPRHTRTACRSSPAWRTPRFRGG